MLKNHALKNPQFIDVPTFKVLPKIHKCKSINYAIHRNSNKFISLPFPEDLDSRPIVNNINSPTEYLSHMIDRLLQPFMIRIPSFIKDSFHFLERLKKSYIGNYTLTTFDIESMYPSIPNDLGLTAIDYWLNRFPDLLPHRFSNDMLINAIKIVLENNFFRYKNMFYHQICGVAMGTKLAVTYANLTIAFLENTVLIETIPINLNLYLQENFMRFLDDCFLIWDNNYGNPQDFLHILNQLHPNIRFTMERNNNKINFLDVQIEIINGKVKSDIYYKPTNNFMYTPFYSNIPRSIKRNISYTLAYRINKLVNDEEIKNKRFEELYHHLIQLKYPSNLIIDAIHRTTLNTNSSINTENKKILPFVTQYNNHYIKFYKDIISPSITNLKSTYNFLNQYTIKPTYRSSEKLISSLQNKSIKYSCSKCESTSCKTCPSLIIYSGTILINNIPIKLNSNVNCTTKSVIYVLTCQNCKKFYIGKTKNSLRIRNNLHRTHITTDSGFMNVSKHIKQCSNGNYNITIIHQVKSKDPKRLSFTESYFIDLLNPPLNS